MAFRGGVSVPVSGIQFQHLGFGSYNGWDSVLEGYFFHIQHNKALRKELGDYTLQERGQASVKVQ